MGLGLASPFLDTGRPTLLMLQLLGAEAHPPGAPRAMLGLPGAEVGKPISQSPAGMILSCVYTFMEPG